MWYSNCMFGYMLDNEKIQRENKDNKSEIIDLLIDLRYSKGHYAKLMHEWYMKNKDQHYCKRDIRTNDRNDKNVNTNLRYKQGKNLGYEGDKVLEGLKPERLFLPKPNVSTTYVFATEDQFFAYPNNYNHYVNMYKDTFQHGGVSLEEMIVPLIFLTSKNG